MTTPKILLMAGGTGGHIFPALAVAKFLQMQGWDAHWLGSANGMEESLVPKHNISIDSIPVSGVRGKSLLTRLLAPFQLIRAIWCAIKIILRYRPDVVLGMGGFASGPGGLASWLLGYPLCIHEQNAVSGLTNRWLAKIATYKLEAFPGSLKQADEQVGNPVRADISAIEPPDRRLKQHLGDLRILIIGGSRGAAVLNEIVPKSAALIGQETPLEIWHQVGSGNKGIVTERYSEAGFNLTDQSITVSDFIDDMPKAYAWADLVICRSGALTVSELAAVGLAAIFIPFPHAVDDHQTKNAAYLVDVKAAEIIPQAEFSEQSLTDKVLAIGHRNNCIEMAKRAREMSKPNATTKVAEYCAKASGLDTQRWAA